MLANSVIRSAYPNADCRWPDPLRPSSALELDQYAATGTYPTFPPPPSDWIVDKAPSVREGPGPQNHSLAVLSPPTMTT